MPSLLVGFGIGLGFQFLGWQTSLFTSALGAQLTWTLPFGMFAMFAVVNRFNRSWEEAAADLGASAFQRLRYVTLPLEIYAPISSATSPTLFAIGTLTTGGSFLAIAVTLILVMRMQRRRTAASLKVG